MTGPDPAPSVLVRRAVPDDAPAIRAIALAAWRATYADLVGSDAVERFLAQAYTPERVLLRIERHTTWVASGSADAAPAAFLEAMLEDGHVHVVAFYARPDARGRGLGSALLDAVVAHYPGLDVSADVLIGNTLGEPFYLARGFEPGELLVEELAGRAIEERRWWLRASRDSARPGPARA